MDNQEIRRKILEFLYNDAKKNSRKVPMGIIKQEIGIEYNELDFNIDYLENEGYIDVERAMKVYFVKIKSKGINLVENPNEFSNLFPTLYIGKVENFALGDINNYNTTIYLNALIHAIEESEDVPPEQKKNLVDKVKKIANNPYVSGIGAGLIVEGIKAGLMNVKPF